MTHRWRLGWRRVGWRRVRRPRPSTRALCARGPGCGPRCSPSASGDRWTRSASRRWPAAPESAAPPSTSTTKGSRRLPWTPAPRSCGTRWTPCTPGPDAPSPRHTRRLHSATFLTAVARRAEPLPRAARRGGGGPLGALLHRELRGPLVRRTGTGRCAAPGSGRRRHRCCFHRPARRLAPRPCCPRSGGLRPACVAAAARRPPLGALSRPPGTCPGRLRRGGPSRFRHVPARPGRTRLPSGPPAVLPGVVRAAARP